MIEKKLIEMKKRKERKLIKEEGWKENKERKEGIEGRTIIKW